MHIYTFLSSCIYSGTTPEIGKKWLKSSMFSEENKKEGLTCML